MGDYLIRHGDDVILLAKKEAMQKILFLVEGPYHVNACDRFLDMGDEWGSRGGFKSFCLSLRVQVHFY